MLSAERTQAWHNLSSEWILLDLVRALQRSRPRVIDRNFARAARLWRVAMRLVSKAGLSRCLSRRDSVEGRGWRLRPEALRDKRVHCYSHFGI